MVPAAQQGLTCGGSLGGDNAVTGKARSPSICLLSQATIAWDQRDSF